MRSLLLAIVLLSGCSTTPPVIEVEEFASQCQLECSDLALALVEAKDYKNALSAIQQAHKHGRDEHRFDTPREPAIRSARAFQLAIAELVVLHRLDKKTTQAWRDLDAKLASFAGLDDPDAFAYATADFVPKQDRHWFETELAKQQLPALMEFGGLILQDWLTTLPRQWVPKPSKDTKLIHLYLAANSNIVGKTQYLEWVSAYVAPRGAPDRTEELDALLASARIVQPFLDTVTPDYKQTLEILVFAAKDRGMSADIIPLPGAGLPGLKGCVIVEPLIMNSVRSHGRDAKILTRLSDCLVHLGHSRFAKQTLTQALKVDPTHEEALELGVLNVVLSNHWVKDLNKLVKDAGRSDLQLALEAHTAVRFRTMVEKTAQLPESTTKRYLQARIAFYSQKWGEALLGLRSVITEYRSQSATSLALKANLFAGNVDDVPAITANMKEKNAISYLQLMLLEMRQRGEKAKVIETAEALIELDEDGSCQNVMFALGYATSLDYDYGFQRFADWKPWLQTRSSKRCRYLTTAFLSLYTNDFEARIKEMYPTKFLEGTMNVLFPHKCGSFRQKALKEAYDNAKARGADDIERQLNAYAWCRVTNHQSAPETHAELGKSKNANIQDTLAWSYLLNGENDKAAATWKGINSSERHFIGDIGIYLAEKPDLPEDQLNSLWNEVRAEILRGDISLMAYTMLAEHWANTGQGERSRMLYEFLARYYYWGGILPSIEEKCPTCRAAFRDTYGHEYRLWSIPTQPQPVSPAP